MMWAIIFWTCGCFHASIWWSPLSKCPCESCWLKGARWCCGVNTPWWNMAQPQMCLRSRIWRSFLPPWMGVCWFVHSPNCENSTKTPWVVVYFQSCPGSPLWWFEWRVQHSPGMANWNRCVLWTRTIPFSLHWSVHHWPFRPACGTRSMWPAPMCLWMSCGFENQLIIL